jgi:hypothetical protein
MQIRRESWKSIFLLALSNDRISDRVPTLLARMVTVGERTMICMTISCISVVSEASKYRMTRSAMIAANGGAIRETDRIDRQIRNRDKGNGGIAVGITIYRSTTKGRAAKGTARFDQRMSNSEIENTVVT